MKLIFNKKNRNFNLYSEIQKKNISVDLLKQIIQARIDEIIQLVLKNNKKKNNFLKKIQNLFLLGVDLNCYQIL